MLYSLNVAEPVERMVQQRDVEVRVQCAKLHDGRIQAAASNAKLRMIIVIFAEQGTVQGEDANLYPRISTASTGPQVESSGSIRTPSK